MLWEARVVLMADCHLKRSAPGTPPERCWPTGRASSMIMLTVRRRHIDRGCHCWSCCSFCAGCCNVGNLPNFPAAPPFLTHALFVSDSTLRDAFQSRCLLCLFMSHKDGLPVQLTPVKCLHRLLCVRRILKGDPSHTTLHLTTRHTPIVLKCFFDVPPVEVLWNV